MGMISHPIPEDQKTRRTTFTVLLVLVCFAVGWFDYATGTVNLFLFYAIPVTIAAIRLSNRHSVFISVLSACIAIATAILNHSAFNSLINLGNLFLNLAFFAYLTFIAIMLRRILDRERSHARTDWLTGAVNSRALEEIIELELERSRRSRRGFSLAFVDIDDFKLVNDQYGHHGGDRILSDLVAGLKTRLRQTDTVARLGGDELVILLPETTQADAALVLADFQKKWSNSSSDGIPHPEISVGLASIYDPGMTALEALKRVDALVYQAKANGKGRIVEAPRPANAE